MGNYISRPQQIGTTQEGHSEKRDVVPHLSPCPSLPIEEPTQSFWTYPPSSIATHTSRDSFPTQADVVIIGSGITGASFARTLLGIDQERHDVSAPLSVVMLEAQETCSGATGRNGGHINPPLYHDYDDLKRSLGAPTAQQIMHFRLAHLEVLPEVAQAEADGADCREVEAVDVYFDETVFAEARRKLNIYKADMTQEAKTYRVWEGAEARNQFSLSPLAVGCITTRAGAIHPYRFVTSILSRLLEEYPKHFQLFTQTPCTSITGPSPTNPFYCVNTPRGQLMASHMVHLTNAYVGGLIPGLADTVHKVRETMSAQRPGRGLQLKAADDANGHGRRSYVFFDSPSRKGFDYLTQLPNGEHELMFGGGLEAVYDADAGDACRPAQSRGMYDVHSAAHVSGALPVYFGARNWGAEGEDTGSHGWSPWAAGRVKALWSGALSVSVDGFPWVGRVPPALSGRLSPPSIEQSQRMVDSGEWVAVGYSGEGMVHAWLCARALALMVLGLDTATDIETEGQYGAGQSVDEWLPGCYRISETRWKHARRISKGLNGREAVVRGGTGKMKVYSGVDGF
ncbi:DAO-domain-containing protein [Gyrodon lividus]|nr:DAO-domain-containing protein [Gyrodon lividus]